MGRFLKAFTILALLVGLAAVQPAESANRYFVHVVNEQGDTGVGAVGRCRVLTTGTTTDATVYTTSTLGTAATNPISLGSDGECSWWGAGPATTAAYDVIVVIDSGTYKGSRVHVPSVTAQTARKVLVTRSSAQKVLMIPYSGTTAATNSDTRTVPAGAVVTRAVVEGQVGVAGGAMHIGHSNIGVDGYCSAVAIQVNDAYTYCAATAPTAANGRIHATTAFAVQYTTQGHTASGYIWLYYIPSTF